MNNKHLNIDELTKYFLNKLTRDNETGVQEHLSSCDKCLKKLDDIRVLKKSIFGNDNYKFFQNKPLFKILSSNLMKFAAAAVLIIGTGLGFYLSNDSGYDVVNDGIVPESVFCVDSLSQEDSVEYYCPEAEIEIIDDTDK